MATSPEDIANAAAVRRRIWEYTVQHDIAPILRPVFDRIPNFVVAEEAGCATRVAAWRGGDPIEVNPDTPDSAIHTPCAFIHCVIAIHTSASALPAMGRSLTVPPTFIPPCSPVAHRGYVVSRVFGENPLLRISLKDPARSGLRGDDVLRELWKAR